MKKTKGFARAKFAPEVISNAVNEVRRSAPEEWERSGIRGVTRADERWDHDTDEEFFADYRKEDVDTAHLYFFGSGYGFEVSFRRYETSVAVEAPGRPLIERVFAYFEDAAEASLLPVPPVPPKPKPTIFVGHGRNPQWRDVKDHLHEKHGYPIQAYEIGARAGHTIRDILEDMLSSTSIALLVMTGEDEDTEGKLHARDNVIHEVGLFQGRLGWSRAIVLLEQGTVEFSNIHGIQQIRFACGNIASTFGEILATLAREFHS